MGRRGRLEVANVGAGDVGIKVASRLPHGGTAGDTLAHVVSAQWPSGHSWPGGQGWPNGHGGERVVVAVRDSSEAEHLLRRATVLAGRADGAEVFAVHVVR